MLTIKKCASWLLSLLVACLIIEGFFVLVYWIRDGQYIPATTALKKIAPREYNLTQLTDCDSKRALAPHPYLGFSHLTKSFCGEGLVGGHTGAVFPFKKQADSFYVMLTGASVPKQLLTTQPSLQKLLSRYNMQGRNIVVLDGTDAAWKQPQQLILLMLSLQQIDAVITLEGFNELSFNKTYQYRHDFAIPFWPAYRKANLGTLIGLQDHLLLLFAERTFLFVDTHSLLAKSRTTYFFLDMLRKYMRSTIQDMDAYPVAGQVESAFKLPDDWDYDSRREYFFQQYLQYIKTMHTLATSNNIRFEAFLQPVSAVGKPLSTAEQSALLSIDYRDDYMELERRLTTLNKQNVPVHSLVQLFADHPETLYKDAIHLQPNGLEILNQAILKTLIKDWKLTPVRN